MKKILLFFAALAVAFSAMASTVTFTAGTDVGTTSITKGGITLTATTFAGTSYYQTYKSSNFTVTSTVGNITSVVITCTASDAAKYGPGCYTDATVGSYSYSGTTGTWTGDAASFTMTASSNQVRMTQVVVTYTDSETVNTTAIALDQTTLAIEQYRTASLVATLTPSNSTQGVTWSSSNESVATINNGVVTAVAIGNATITATSGSVSATCAVTVSAATPITCAQAAEYAATVSGNNVPYAGGKYVIRGYVTAIVSAYDSSYGNLSVWMADAVNGSQVFEAYHVKPVSEEDQTIVVGQQVEVVAQITKYGTTYETMAGGSIRIIESTVDPDVVAAPEFDVKGGSYFSAQTITITQAAGKPIYYTLDGTDPTTNEEAVLYTTPLTITEGGTIKAAAKDGDNWSSVVTETYVFVASYANIAALKNAITATAAADAVDMYVTLTDAVVTYINGSNYYIQDASAGILIYSNTQTVSSVLTAAGVKLNGTMKCAGYIFNGLYELTKSFDFTHVTATPGAAIPCTEVTIAQLNANIAQYESMRVKVVEATVSSALTSRKAKIAVDTDTIQIYEKVSGNLSSTALATKNKVATVIGYPGVNNSTKQLNVWLAADVTEVIPAGQEAPEIGWKVDGTIVEEFELDYQNPTTAPVFAFNGEVEPQFATSNSAIATVLDGTIYPTGARGKVLLTATSEESDHFTAGEAELLLTVNNAKQHLLKETYVFPTEFSYILTNVDLATEYAQSFDMIFAKGENNSNGPKYYNSNQGKEARVYINNTLTIDAADPIVAIVFKIGSKSTYVQPAVTAGSILSTEKKTAIWTINDGTTTNATITFAGTYSFEEVTVYYAVSEMEKEYYVKGSKEIFGGSDNYEVLAANLMEENNGEYTLLKENVELAAGTYYYQLHEQLVAPMVAESDAAPRRVAAEAKSFELDKDGTYTILFTSDGVDITATDPSTGWATGIQNAEAVKVEKIFRNGQVVIIKNGVEYNAIGQKL